MKTSFSFLAIIGVFTCFIVFVLVLSISFSPTPEVSAQLASSKGKLKDKLVYDKWFYGQRAYPHSTIPPGLYQKAVKTALGQRLTVSASSSTPTWQSVGPSPISLSDYGGLVSGRVSAIAFDPAHQGTVYLGAAQGGIWKSTDGGSTWKNMTDNQPSLAVGSIAVDPSGIVYVGTGEGNDSCDSYYGVGILKSTDGGVTWTQLGGSLFDSETITKIVIDPIHPNVILVATGVRGHTTSATGVCQVVSTGSPGIYKSIDGGNTWTLTLSTNIYSGVSDLISDPSNSQIVYAGVQGSGIYKSTNGGSNFTLLQTQPLPSLSVGRISLGISTQPTNTLFAAMETTIGDQSGTVFSSTDGGDTWTQMQTPLEPSGTTSFCGFQCNYDLYVAPDPTNAAIVYLGGYDVWRTINGGGSWTDLGGFSGYIHPDQHMLAFNPTSHSNAYIGNDGGVWSSSAVDTCSPATCWTNLNLGLTITQFYSIAVSNDPNQFFGGTQDNGTPEHTGTSTIWSLLDWGDGGFTAFDLSNPSTMYHSLVGISPDRSDDGGSTWTPIETGINLGDCHSDFIPMAIDLQNPSTLYLGTNNTYKTTNKGANWSLTGFQGSCLDSTSAIAVAPSNDNYVYVGTQTGKFYVSTNGGIIFTELDTGLPNRFLTKIAVDPSNPQKVYATFSGFGGKHVFFSPDNGNTWSDISSNLPDLPTNTILVKSGFIFVGNDLGPYFSTNGGTSWSLLGTGFPNVSIFDLALTSDNKLLAATHGRGVWEIPVVGLPAPVQIDITVGSASSSSPCVVSDNCYSPNPVYVSPGTTIIWNNIDSVPHTITSGKVTDGNAGSLFDSVLIHPGGTFQFTFANVGIFDYFDVLRPWLTGQVVVYPSCSSVSPDWTISSSCILGSTSSAPTHVIVRSGAVLIIPNGVKLNIDLKHYHLLVKSGGGVLVMSGGAIN